MDKEYVLVYTPYITRNGRAHLGFTIWPQGVLPAIPREKYRG